MTQPQDITVRVVATEIRRYRDARKMSAQRLSDACAEAGVTIPRSVLANLESGRRPTISVAELLAIAYALRVNPIDLLVPGAPDDEPYNIAPNVTTTTATARAWIAGLGFLEPPESTEEFAELIRSVSKERAAALSRAWFTPERQLDYNRQVNAAEKAVDPDRLGGFWGSDGGFSRADGVSFTADEVRDLMKGDETNG